MASLYRDYLKRAADCVLAFIALLLVSPLLLLTTVILLVANCGRPFFIQERPGRNAVVFRILKFKTMTDRRDASGRLLPDNQRITRVGRFIRDYSIDELPQLINVLKGDMALVGPRPLLVEHLARYDRTQARRHEVRPGITGWAQVNGRNSLSWDQKLTLDVWYVDRISFALDCRILLLTVKKVLKREGVDFREK